MQSSTKVCAATTNSGPLTRFLDANALDTLGQWLATALPRASARRFVAVCRHQIIDLSLFARVDYIADALNEVLPRDTEEAIVILLNMIPPGREAPGYGSYSGLIMLPITRYVSRYALAFPDLALGALAEMTKRFTSEFDVRPFVERYPQKSLAAARLWAKDANLHVRRLASEGLRPRLPWARHLNHFKLNPTPLIDLLSLLVDDESVYVRKSVANCMADILKDNRTIGCSTLEHWGASETPQRRWIIRRALRFSRSKGIPCSDKLRYLSGEA